MSDIDQIVVVDTETSGLEPGAGALLEVAWVALQRDLSAGTDWDMGGEGTYDSAFIEYEGEIPAEARAVHHIGPDDVRPGAPNCFKREHVVHSLLAAEEPGNSVYAAHNRNFDMKWLPELGAGYDDAEDPEGSAASRSGWICTWRCAMHLFPEAPKFSNQVLRYHLGAEPPAEMLGRLTAHRALYDTACTAAILLRMLRTHTPEQLLDLSSRPVLLRTMSFGKHRGEPYEEVARRDKSYLRWMLDKSDVCQNNPDALYTVLHYLGLPTDEVRV